jgi:hypothetical protein
MEILACFIVVNGRQIFSKALLYLHHNQMETFEELQTANNLSMIYAILSPNGISHQLKKYLHLIYDKGYLTPEECEDNVFAKRALELYPLAHERFLKSGREGLQEFVNEKVLEIYQNELASVEELMLSGDLTDGDFDSAEEIEEEMDDDQDSEQAGDEINGEDGEQVEDQENDAFGAEDEGEKVASEDYCDCEFCVEMREYGKIDLDSLKLEDPSDQRYLDLLKQQLRR